jgi:hypothetical protein
MSDLILHDGTWTRQVLKYKRKVRVTFVPDDSTRKPESVQISIDDDSKTAWKRLLGDPADDIDLGLVIVRFNEDDKSGMAIFLPDRSKQPEIVHVFQQMDPLTNLPVAGTGEFFNCISGKRNVLGVNFNYPLAFAECLPQLLV